MKRLTQFDPICVETIKEAVYTFPKHSHTYYEIVYINEGSGIHTFNGKPIPYRSGDSFLLSPVDHHFFVIDQFTHFTYIKFTDSYFNATQHLSPNGYYAGTPEDLMNLQELKETKIELDEPCQTVLRQTIDSMVHYNKLRAINHSSIFYYLLLSVFGMIREFLHARQIRLGNAEPNQEQLSAYVHKHIYTREKISVKAIAAHFNISQNYFSNYFKRNFGLSYQQYLDQYRIKLVEKRLELGESKLKQVAEEFGFTDVSHLAKVFKKHKGISPTSYRKALIDQLIYE